MRQARAILIPGANASEPPVLVLPSSSVTEDELQPEFRRVATNTRLWETGLKSRERVVFTRSEGAAVKQRAAREAPPGLLESLRQAKRERIEGVGEGRSISFGVDRRQARSGLQASAPRPHPEPGRTCPFFIPGASAHQTTRCTSTSGNFGLCWRRSSGSRRRDAMNAASDRFVQPTQRESASRRITGTLLRLGRRARGDPQSRPVRSWRLRRRSEDWFDVGRAHTLRRSARRFGRGDVASPGAHRLL